MLRVRRILESAGQFRNAAAFRMSGWPRQAPERGSRVVTNSEEENKMKRFSLFALLAASLALLALPDDAAARHCRHRRFRFCQTQFHASYQACPCPSNYVASGGNYSTQSDYYGSAGYSTSQPDYTAPPPPTDRYTTTEPRLAEEVVEVEAIDGQGFEPKEISIEPGTTVRWTNRGEHRHTVTARNGMFDSELPPGGSFSFTLEQTGTVEYFCKPHEDMGMVGTITVESATNTEIGSESSDTSGADTTPTSSDAY
jgi:plastocyanin